MVSPLCWVVPLFYDSETAIMTLDAPPYAVIRGVVGRAREGEIDDARIEQGGGKGEYMGLLSRPYGNWGMGRTKGHEVGEKKGASGASMAGLRKKEK